MITKEQVERDIAIRLAAQPAAAGDTIRQLNYTVWMKGAGGCEPPKEWQEAYERGHRCAIAEMEAPQPSLESRDE